MGMVISHRIVVFKEAVKAYLELSLCLFINPCLNYFSFFSQECLFHAMKEKRYRTVGALVFVMDRFTYWQGMSNRTLQIVEYLKTNSPDIPIAPQLLIRNVRIMKNAGNLQGICKFIFGKLLL